MAYPIKKLYWVEKSKNYAGIKLIAPISGQVEAINDSMPLINKGIIGEGVIINISSNRLLSPISGEVLQISGSGHRMQLKATNGLKIALQFPLENAKLMGEGFNTQVKQGQQVKAGELLATYNLQQLQRQQPKQYLAVLITNAELIGKILVVEQKVTAGEDVMMTVTAKPQKAQVK